MDTSAVVLHKLLTEQNLEIWAKLKLVFLDAAYSSLYSAINRHYEKYHSVPSFDDLTLSGNLILTANLLYSIGGDTGRLRHIYAGNVTTVTANVGTVNTGNITAGNITVTGNVQGNYMLGDGSKLSNLPPPGASTGKAIAMAIVFGG